MKWIEPTGSKRPKRSGGRAFSIIELLVAVTVLVFIVIALYQVFNQTQRALLSNQTQVDVLESGRAAFDLMSRELQQIQASGLFLATNFYVSEIPVPPVYQELPGGDEQRTNVLEDLFFLTHPEPDQWTGIGYRVLGATNGVGVLSRFSIAANKQGFNPDRMLEAFMAAKPDQFQPVAGGIIDFEVKAYDSLGRPMRYYRLDPYRETANTYYTNVVLVRDRTPEVTHMAFLSNAIPSYVDVELGLLEPRALRQFESMPDSQSASNFLAGQAAKVHLFRQRISIWAAPHE